MKPQIIYSILLKLHMLISNFEFFYIHAHNRNWMDILMEQIEKDNNYHQITIFKSSNIVSSEEIYILKNLFRKIPIVIIDIRRCRESKDKVISKLPIFQHPRKVTMYILLEHMIRHDIQDRISSIISILSNLSAFSVKPKFLVIIFNNNSISDESINGILKYAWLEQFLDFTIIKVNQKSNSISCDARIFSYNPFVISYRNQCISESVLIFPDKVIDVNGFILKVPYYFPIPPFAMLSYKNNSQLVGSTHAIIDFVAQVYNFTLDIVSLLEISNNSGKTLSTKPDYSIVRTNLRHGKLDVISFQYFLGYLFIDRNENEVVSEVIHFDNCLLITPILYKRIRDTKIETLITLLLGASMIIFLVYFVKKLTRYLEMRSVFTRNSMEHISSFAIIKIILNQTVKNQPQNITDKCFMFYFIIISMSYFSNFYAELTKIKMLNEEISFQSFQDIDKSNMKIHVSTGLYDTLSANIKSKTLPSKLTVVDDIQDCVKRIMNGERIICFTTEMRIPLLLQDYKQFRNYVPLRIINVEFYNAGKTYIFRKNFPFLYNFNKIFRKILESGISKAWPIEQNYSRSLFLKYRKPIDDDKNILLQQLLFIIQIGYGLSLIVFLVEILLFYINGKLKLLHSKMSS